MLPLIINLTVTQVGLISFSLKYSNNIFYINIINHQGIFYIHASAPPQYVGDMCNVIGQELLKMAGPCDPVRIKFYFKQLV